MFLENVFPPIPSEVIMPLAGFAAARGNLEIGLVIVSGTIGSVAGAYVWFLIGLWLGRGRVEVLIRRYGRILTMSLDDFDRARDWFRWRANAAVFVGRVVPTIRTLISVPAGILPMRQGPFLLFTTLGTVIWTTGLALAGYVMEAHYAVVADWVDPLSTAVVAVVVLGYLYRVATWRPPPSGIDCDRSVISFGGPDSVQRGCGEGRDHGGGHRGRTEIRPEAGRTRGPQGGQGAGRSRRRARRDRGARHHLFRHARSGAPEGGHLPQDPPARRRGGADGQGLGPADRRPRRAARDHGAFAGNVPDFVAFADADLVGHLAGLVGDAALEPLFEIRVSRTLRTLVSRGGDAIECALDEGEVVAGDRRRPIAEAEFELKEGDPRALFQVARQVMTAVPVRFSRHAKSELGYRLLDGEAEDGPVKAAEAEIADDATVETALRDILRSCFAQIAANAVVVAESDDPEGPHQLRVGLRRLRSAFTLFKDIVDRPTAARLIEETRWLAGKVGDLRDLDVLVEEIVRPCAERVDARALIAILDARRAQVRGELLDLLAGPRVGAFLIDLAAYVEGRGWLSFSNLDQTGALAAPAREFAEAAIRKQWNKVSRHGRDVDALSGEERHDLRKAFKKLRYGFDFFGSAFAGKDRRKAIKDVKAAQEVLGYLNDVLMAERMAEIIKASPEYKASKDKPAVERAIGYCLGWHQAGAERTWEASKALVSLDPDEV